MRMKDANCVCHSTCFCLVFARCTIHQNSLSTDLDYTRAHTNRLTDITSLNALSHTRADKHTHVEIVSAQGGVCGDK